MKKLGLIMLFMVALAWTGCHKDKEMHGTVDLGLPSGTLWATCNIGASSPENHGNYYAWGETTTKSHYGWGTYKHCKDYLDKLSKYCNASDYGYNGFTDNLTVLQPEDDAAMANWGKAWCMPTFEQWEELVENTTCTLTSLNDVRGVLFTASNGNSIFIPVTGSYNQSYYYQCDDDDGVFSYWSSSLYMDEPSNAMASHFFFDYDDMYVDTYYDYFNHTLRCLGLPVRPVRSSSKN